MASASIYFRIKSFLVNMVFPSYCIECGEEGEFLCRECFLKIKKQRKKLCFYCKKHSFYGETCVDCIKTKNLDGVIISAVYSKSDILKNAVYGFKYKFIKELSKPLAELLISSIPQNIVINTAAVTSVPLHHSKENIRGFNQAEILAKTVAEHFSLEYKPFLKRIRNTVPQSGLDKNHRKKNLIHAFDVLKREKILKNILIIDDICATGATLEECARILKKNGATTVWGAVLGRG